MIQIQDDEYSLSLTESELRTILLSLLVLPDRYEDDAVQDLIGSSKQEISDLHIRISDEKHLLDRERVRRKLVEEGLQATDSSESLGLPSKSLPHLTDALLVAARARVAGIEKRDVRRDILEETSISNLIAEIDARPGGADVLSELASHGEVTIRFALADQWHGIMPQVAARILEEISRDSSRPLLAYAAGFRYRQNRR